MDRIAVLSDLIPDAFPRVHPLLGAVVVVVEVQEHQEEEQGDKKG